MEEIVLPDGTGLSGTKGPLGLCWEDSGEQATEDSSERLVFYKLLLGYVLWGVFFFFFFNTVFLYAFCKVVLTGFVQEKKKKTQKNLLLQGSGLF